jgi:uncharacterized protein
MILTYALVVAFMLLGSLAQGALGIGIGIVAAPFVAALDPTLVPGALMVPMLLAAAWMAARERRRVDWRWTRLALIGRVPGTLAGAWLLAVLPAIVYAWVFATAVLLAVAASLVGPRLHPTGGRLLAAGLLSGTMGTLTAIGGPPMMLLLQHAPPPVLRATFSAYFAIGALMSIAALALFGGFGRYEALAGLGLAVPMVLGLRLSRHLVARVDAGMMRPALLVLASFAAPMIVLRALLLD